MLALIPQPVRDMPARWRHRAEERRQLSKVDPAADALETAAGELEAVIKQATETGQLLSTVEFAQRRGVRPSTVRKWCARGQLAGAQKNGAQDWIIPADATPARRRKSA